MDSLIKANTKLLEIIIKKHIEIDQEIEEIIEKYKEV